MPLWGLDDTLADKPKIHGRSLLDATQTPGELDPRTGIYATTAGWVQGGVGRTGKNLMPEVLVAIRGLTTLTGAAGTADAGFGAAAHVAADITSFNWNITTFDKSVGGTNAAGTSLSVTANFNETVTVTGVPKLVVLGTGGRNHNLTYTGGTTTSRLTFKKEIGGGATIHDTVAGAGTAAVITNVVGIGTAAGTVTVVT